MPVDEFMCTSERVLKMLEEAEIQNAQVLKYLSEDHVRVMGWTPAVRKMIAIQGTL